MFSPDQDRATAEMRRVATSAKLGDDQVTAVLELLFQVEQNPTLRAADLEFCFADEKLYALQARPLLSF